MYAFCGNLPLTGVDLLGLLSKEYAYSQLDKAASCFRKSCSSDCPLIAAAVGAMYVEMRRTSEGEGATATVQRFRYVSGTVGNHFQSLGPGQIYPDVADEVIRNNPSTFPEIKAVDPTSRSYRAALDNLIWNAPCRLVYWALRDFTKQWDAAREDDPSIPDITFRPEILASLYNLGPSKSIPHANPRSGGSVLTIDGVTLNFGDHARRFIESPDGKGFLVKSGCPNWNYWGRGKN